VWEKELGVAGQAARESGKILVSKAIIKPRKLDQRYYIDKDV
jgi:hypothetical protein